MNGMKVRTMLAAGQRSCTQQPGNVPGQKAWFCPNTETYLECYFTGPIYRSDWACVSPDNKIYQTGDSLDYLKKFLQDVTAQTGSPNGKCDTADWQAADGTWKPEYAGTPFVDCTRDATLGITCQINNEAGDWSCYSRGNKKAFKIGSGGFDGIRNYLENDLFHESVNWG